MKNLNNLIIYSFLRAITMYVLLLVVWPLVFQPSTLLPMVDYKHDGIFFFLLNGKILLLLFLFFMPIAGFYEVETQMGQGRYKDIRCILFTAAYAYAVINTLYYIRYNHIYHYHYGLPKQEVYNHYFFLVTFEELVFIHFVNTVLTKKLKILDSK